MRTFFDFDWIERERGAKKMFLSKLNPKSSKQNFSDCLSF